MKFATLAHFGDEHIDILSDDWNIGDFIVSPEYNINGTRGYVIAIRYSPIEMMSLQREKIRNSILKALIFAQENLDVNIIQLGALTTSVTNGGLWLQDKKDYEGYLTHGDSYTAAVTCQSVKKILNELSIDISKTNLAIIGSYGIIGEAVSKILVPKFKFAKLIGRRTEKLKELSSVIKGNFETSVELDTKYSDVIITATNHPSALLNGKHLKKNAIVIDVSQPPNLSYEVCKKRPDVIRIDGGYVDFPKNCHMSIPGMPKGKMFSCIVEVIMQTMENEKKNHLGSIDIDHLQKTIEWGKKYDFRLKELTNFGKGIEYGSKRNKRFN
ncbi:MAG: hypothetical protein V5A64_02815 [Candidatus Thermoplasmatota archaeon]